MKEFFEIISMTVIIVLCIIGFVFLLGWLVSVAEPDNCSEYSKGRYESNSVPIKCYEEYKK